MAKLFSGIFPAKFFKNAPQQDYLFLLLTIVIGLLTGLAAVAFHHSITWAETNIIGRAFDIPSPWNYLLMITIPTLGGLIVGALLHFWAPEARGSGIPQVKSAYFINFGKISIKTGIAKFFIGAFSIGSGASLGREGPTVQISAAIASWVGQLRGLSPKQIMRLIPLAAAGGIAAAFNTPLAAIMFAIEEVMGDLKQNALAGIVLVAVIAAVIERSILGPTSVFSVPEHVIFNPLEMVIVGIFLGVLSGVVSHGFVEGLLGLRQWFNDRTEKFTWTSPAIGGFLTGIVGVIVFFFTERTGVFGIGYQDLSDSLFGRINLVALALLFVGKFLATIFSYSSGGAGGIFAPTLFIGAMLGGLAATVINLIPGIDQLPLGPLSIIGMGAMFAGVIRAPVTSILIIFELTGDYALILPIMFSNLIAFAVARSLREIPIYEALLLQDGINLRKFPILSPGHNWQKLPVNTIMTHDVEVLRLGMRMDEAMPIIQTYAYKLFPVLDENDKLCGLVHRKGIINVNRIHPDRTLDTILIVDDMITVTPEKTIKSVANKFVQTDHTIIPVVSKLDKQKLLGVVTLHDITRQQFFQEAQDEE